MPEPDDQLRRYAEAAADAVPAADLAEVRSRRQRPPRRWALLAAAAVLVMAGLGAALIVAGRSDPAERVATDPEPSVNPDPETEPGTDATGLPFGLDQCSPDAPSVAAARDLYRDEPVYVGNEMPIEEVQTWAQAKPGFVTLWIDRSHNGWITVAFTEDADERQAEMEEVFPGVGVVAVAVDWTLADLEQLRTDATEALAAAGVTLNGSGIDESRGRIILEMGELSEERLAPLATFAGSRLCVSGVDPAEVVPDGPQVTEGDGWRLLGWDRTGSAYRTSIATTDDQYDALWAASGLGGDPEEVDFETEVVIWFGAVYGSGCETRMDDVVVDQEHKLVHGLFVLPGAPRGCPADANPKAYVVAVERDRLPEGPFAIQLQATDPPLGVPEERTVVDADLRAPGSVATDDQIDPV